MLNLNLQVSWPVRVILALFALLLVLYMSMVAVLSTAWAHRVMTRYLANKIEQATGARPEIAWIEVHPAVFRVVVHGLVLHGNEGIGQQPLLTAGTLDVTLNPRSLVLRRLYIRRFDVVGMAIHLYTEPDGSMNLPGPKRATHLQGNKILGQLLNLRVRNFSLNHSALYWNNQRISLDFAAKDLALLLSFGPGTAYTGSFSSSGLRGSVSGQNLPSLEVSTQIRISARQIELNNVVWRTEGGSGTGTGTVELADSPTVKFELMGNLNLESVARVLDLSSIHSGNARFSARGTYAQGLLRASGHSAVRNLRMEFANFKPGLADVSANFRVDQARLVLTQITARIMDGEARGEATARLGGARPRINFQGTIHGVDLASFIQAIPNGEKVSNLFNMDSRLSGHLGLSYNETPGDIRADFDVQGAPPSTGGGGPMAVRGSASGSVEIGKEFELQIASAIVNTPHSNLEAQGRLASQASNLHFQYQTRDFEESRSFVQYLEGPQKPIPLVLESAARVSGTVLGSLKQPEIHGRMSFGPFQYAGFPWNGFSGNIVVSPKLVQVSTGRLLAGKSPFTFDLRATLSNWQATPASQMEVTAQARQSPLQGIWDAFGLSYPVSGLMDGDVTFEGTPANLKGHGEIEIRQAEAAGEPLDLIRAQATAVNSVIDFSHIEVAKGKGKLKAVGRVDLVRRTFSVDLHGENFQLSGFRRLNLRASSKGVQKARRGLEGLAEIHLQGSGTFDDPQAQAEVDVPDFRLGDVSAGHFETTLGLKGHDARLSAKITGSQAWAVLTASARTEADWPVHFNGKLDKFRIDTGINWLENLKSKVQLSASGLFEGHGSLRSPSTWVMDANLPDLEAALGNLTWKNRQPVHLTYADRKLTADSFELSGPSTNLQLAGSLRFAHPMELDFQVNGQSGASLLSLLDPSLQAAGTIDVELRARGAIENPFFSGTIDVKDLGVGYAHFPFQVAGLNGRIELKGSQATIVELGSSSGQSSIQMRGSVALGAHFRYDLTAALKRARLGFPADFISLLSGNLRLAGTESGGQLSGNLSVTQMYPRESFNLLSWIGRVGSPSPPGPSVSNPLASKIRLNMAVSTSPDVSLESHDLGLVAVIDVALHGTVTDPVVLGTIHLRSGYALIRGTRYKITRGDITMTSPVRTQPVLDLEATTRAEHYDLTLDVTGPLDRAKIAYRSDPPLPTEDILSLLALGYAPQLQQLNAGGAQPAAAVGASALLSQALSSQFSGRVQRLLGVSRIRIDPNLLGPTTAGGVRITVEEQVGRDVTLSYATNTGAAQQRDVRMEWDLSDRISLVAERDINGVYGVELQFRSRFK